MKRRQALFGILGLGAAIASARHAIAQSVAKPVIGLLDAGERVEWWAAFREQLRKLGYVEGKNIAFETRFTRGNVEQIPAAAQELVRLKISVIVTSGTVTAQIAKKATSTIPIVMATGTDPVASGVVASLARPGGNVTGVTSIATGLTPKRFELLREILPRMSRLAVLWHSDNSASATLVRELEAAARSPKVVLQNLGVKSTEEFPAAFAAMTKSHADAVFVIAGPYFYSGRQRIAELALKHRLPSMHGTSEYADAGGLVSYAPSYADLFRHAADYVDKILKGAKPGDLPIEQPTKFELVINQKTARALGVKIPPAVLLRAERVIE